MKRYGVIVDRKSKFSYGILNFINEVCVAEHFAEIRIEGDEKLPKGPFILISNHSARWDGPVVQQVIRRPANWMVSPNELKGLQGFLLRAGGAFPANPKFDLLSFMRNQAAKAEPIVIFPEGDIHKDGFTKPFKPGAARAALICAEDGLDVPIVPMAISYSGTKPDRVRILVGDPIDVKSRLEAYREESVQTIQSLTHQLRREVCSLRAELGSERDQQVLFESKPMRGWAQNVTG